LAVGALLAGEQMSLNPAPSALAIAAVAYQALYVVPVTFVIWFALIVRYSAGRLSAFTFLTPLFGVAAGYFVLGDPLTPSFLVAVALVTIGLILVNRAR
jgi:drug/metabolite transporter (DMT)-like permease